MVGYTLWKVKPIFHVSTSQKVWTSSSSTKLVAECCVANTAPALLLITVSLLTGKDVPVINHPMFELLSPRG